MRRSLLLILGYLALALAMTWPLALRLGTAVPGYPNVDALDTILLRGLVADALAGRGTKGVYWPEGIGVWDLVPNWLDHVTAAPLVWTLPFPWGDNLWWLAVLCGNGLAAHRLGRRVGGSQAAGWLAGTAWMLAEPLAREANLHHAPQAMMMTAPLYVDALLDLRERPAAGTAARAGVWLALSALAYWYLGLFLGIGSLPLLVGLPIRMAGIVAGVAFAFASPALVPLALHWSDLPIASPDVFPAPVQGRGDYSSVPDRMQFVAQHGNDLLFWIRRTPLDTSNRVSLVLLAAALLGWRTTSPSVRRGLVAMAAIGAVLLLGPYARMGEGLLSPGDRALSLPFRWLADLHPFLGRLTWPERWGLLIPLALIPLAARSPRPALVAGLVAIEAFALSGNLPLQTIPVGGQRCWRALATAPGAIVELPLDRGGLLAARVGVNRRYHGRSLVNPILLPPGAHAPAGWRAWLDGQPLLTYLREFEDGRWPADPGADAVRALQSAGVSALALDAEPDILLSDGAIQRYRTGLGRHLGPPIDLGCALVWWIDPNAPPPLPHPDPDAWRKEARAWHAAHPPPALDTLIEPTWSARGATGVLGED